MTELDSIVNYSNNLLEMSRFNDYCPNGLQLQGNQQVHHIVGGVTASLDLIETAIARKADVILVHHGYFWKGESAAIVGMKYQRIRRLIEAGVSLLAYHLPLDAHAVYGNNAQLAQRLGFTREGGFAPHQSIDIASYGTTVEPLTATQLADQLTTVLQREPLLIQGHDRPIRRVGWCTGAAQSYLEEAAALGLDAYISGEVSEHTYHAARELGIDYFAAGHHATERYGVMALGQHISEQFDVTFEFVDLLNPV